MKHKFILPVADPRDLPTITDEHLQHEIDWCLEAIDDASNRLTYIPEMVQRYQLRLRLANDELERRFLLS